MVSLASQCKGESGVRTTPMGIVFAFVFAYIVFSILKAVMGVRVSEEEEDRGLDIAEHGQEAYGS